MAGPLRPRWVKRSFSRKLAEPAEATGFGRYSCQSGVVVEIRGNKGERHKRGPAWLQPQAKLLRDLVAKRRGAHLRDRQASGGDDQRSRGDNTCAGRYVETLMVSHFVNRRRHLDGDAGLSALLLQHGNNVAGGPVAKELPQRLLVPGDVVFFYQFQEIGRSVTSQRGLGKMRVCGKEVICRGVQVGEVTAASTRDEDLFANATGMFEEQHTTATAACMHGAEQPGGACSHDEHVIVGRHCGSSF